MIKLLIAEEEPIVAERLEFISKSVDNKLKIDIIYHSADVLKYAILDDYDIFCLDTKFTEISGFEIAKKIRDMAKYKLTPIIFIAESLKDEDKITAFEEIHCYDYIVKPFIDERLKKPLCEIICNKIKKKGKTEYLDLVDRGCSYHINQNDMVYIEIQNKKLMITTVKKKIVLHTYTLHNVLNKLTSNFVQCHKSYAINLNYIKRIEPEGNVISLECTDSIIPIGRKYKKNLKEKICGLC